jgi:hypothetical protein
MPGKNRYGTVGSDGNPAMTDSGVFINQGKSTKEKITHLRKMFSAPTVNGGAEYTDAVMRDLAKILLFSERTHGDDTLWGPTGVDRMFLDSPDIPFDVTIGGGGLPGSPYGPNPAPPGPSADGSVNVDAEHQPNVSELMELNKFQTVTGKPLSIHVDGLKNPKDEAASIASSVMSGDIKLGSHNSIDSIKFNTK